MRVERYAYGEKVRVLRDGVGLSQQQLADMAGINQSQISKIESGQSGVSIQTLSAIAKVLGCSTGYLLSKGEGAALTVSEQIEILMESLERIELDKTLKQAHLSYLQFLAQDVQIHARKE